MKDQFIKEQIKLVISILIIIVFTNGEIKSYENEIVLRVNNEIITTIDVDNEMRYLLALNPNLNNLSRNEIIKISKKSILKEKIKKIEIDRLIQEKKIPNKYLEELLKQIYFKIGISNILEFKEYLNAKKISYEDVKKKITIEALWNEIIFSKYSSKIKINEAELKDEIDKYKNKLSKSFLLSEIFFEKNKDENLDSKFNEIKKMINENGFNNAALKYSISQTSNLGGKLGWIDESSISNKIKRELLSLKINEYTDPIRVAGGFLILQINDIKNIKSKVDTDKELKKIIRSRTNDQLNQFSKMYFNKVKKDMSINEI